MSRRHLDRSCAASTDSSLSDKSFLMVSNHHPLRPSSPSFPRHLHHQHSLCCHLFLFSSQYRPLPLQHTFMHILRYFSTFAVRLILSFLILSSLVTPLIHHNMFISATSNFFSCAFFPSHISAPYIIAGHSIALYTGN